MTQGRFITIDGVDGAGKSTQLAYMRDFLEAAGLRVVVTREPGGTALAEDIRALLLGRREQAMAADTELLLMFAARAEHIDKLIRPSLAQGHWVLCDRFTDATYAYQGGGRGIASERIAVLENWVQGDLRPDLTLILDVPVERGLARIGRRGPMDRIENEAGVFFQRVREAYRKLAASDTKRYHLIDADRPIDAVAFDIKRLLSSLLT